MLDEIGEKICFAGKGVDINNPIQPVQMPRGYGRVCVCVGGESFFGNKNKQY